MQPTLQYESPRARREPRDAVPTVMAAQVDDFYLQVRGDRYEEDVLRAQQVMQEDCFKLRILHTLARRIDTIIDVGGGLGFFGVFAKSLWPHASLVALEPGNDMLLGTPEQGDLESELYLRNLDANGIEDVTFAAGSLERLVCESNLSGNCLLKLPGAFPRISLPAAAKMEIVVGEFDTAAGFDALGRTARRAFPHLYFYESPEDGSHAAPYWGFPSLPFALTFFGIERARKIFRRRRQYELPLLRRNEAVRPGGGDRPLSS